MRIAFGLYTRAERLHSGHSEDVLSLEGLQYLC